MGIDYSTNLIFGVALENVIIHSKKTKYNTDTGKPYEVDSVEKIFVIKGTSIQVDWDEDDGTPDEVFCEDYEDRDTYYYGVRVPSISETVNGTGLIDETGLAEARDKAVLMLGGMDYSGDVSLINVMHGSY